MNDNSINVEVVPVEIVRCPRCGTRNRLVKQERHVGYRCGGCWAPLANPFERFSMIKRCFQGLARRNSGRGIGKWIAAFLAAFIVVAIVIRQQEPPRASGLDLTSTVPAQPMGSHSKAWIPPVPPPDKPAVFPRWKNRPVPQLEIRQPPPETPPPPPRSLENGTILADVINAGHSVFTVDNSTDRDAVVKLIDQNKGQTVVAIYVTAHNSATANLIPEGTFTVLCGQGLDWDDKINFFTRQRSFEKVEPELDFTMTLRQDGRQIIREYKHRSLQLEPSITGELKESDISEKMFMEY